MMHRRDFLKHSAQAAGGVGLLTLAGRPLFAGPAEDLYKISLAEWSLHKTLFANELDNLDFPRKARQDFGIDAVEYVNQFFKDKAKDQAYLAELKQRAEGEGVRNVLIMCDGEGHLGDPDAAKRTEAVENHYKWVDAAKYLGCHAIRVNAASDPGLSYEEQQKLAADGLGRLGEYGAQHDISVIVENHGGLSSNGEWLTGVMKRVDNPHVGTLPDFGNFRIREGEVYDRYKGVKELMPYAKAVSAKSHDFNDQGEEIHTDYMKMMQIVLDAGYHGHVGIEYEGDGMSEEAGIRATKALLERVREQLAAAQ